MKTNNKDGLFETNPQKGSNSGVIRHYNEKLIMQLIREHGTLTKAEVTRATGLSANAISMISRSLEKNGLIVQGNPIRGRIGQPSIPLSINPEARHYVCLKIGRRSNALAVINFTGDIVSYKHIDQAFPTPTSTLDFLKAELNKVLRSAKKKRSQISGMAVSMPYELWSWTDKFDASKEEMEAWRDFDVVKELKKSVPWNILVENDCTAACRAEQVFGTHLEKKDWIYFFVGTFIGGGIVLTGSVFQGSRGNAGGFGPMPVPGHKEVNRLVDHASLVVLEHMLKNAKVPANLNIDNLDWEQLEPHLGKWIKRAGKSLAYAIVSSLSVIDLEAAVIDGAFPHEIKEKLVKEVRFQLSHTDLQGIYKPEIEAGQIGRRAKIIGGAAALINSSIFQKHNDQSNRYSSLIML